MAIPIPPHYTASKWGVRGLTKTRRSNRPRRHPCQCIHPATVRTPMTAGQTSRRPVGRAREFGDSRA